MFLLCTGTGAVQNKNMAPITHWAVRVRHHRRNNSAKVSGAGASLIELITYMDDGSAKPRCIAVVADEEGRKEVMGENTWPRLRELHVSLWALR